MSNSVRKPRRSRVAQLSIASICAIALPSAMVIAASPSSAEEDKFANGKQVSQGSVAGDGATAQASGDAVLTDGVGATFYINTNITYVTTSSASGAASEASFTNPVAASTVDGGTTNMTLSDGFDGYGSLSTFVGPGAPVDSVDAVRYNQLGAEPTTECGGRQLVYPAQVNGALTVSRKVFVPSDAGYARWNNSVTNTSGAATTATLYIFNNLGSDGRTLITGSSSGDKAGTTADTWVGTFQEFNDIAPGSVSDDPRIGHVFQGTGATPTLIDTFFADDDDNPYWTYQFTLAPGQTKSVLNYATLRGTQAGANSAAAAIATQAPDVCLTQDEANAVQNFKGLGKAPTLTLPANITTSATSPSGAVVNYTATAADGNGKALTVSCTPASGSTFAVGTKTVTCTTTDAQGRTTTGTFNVTVSPFVDPFLGSCNGEDVTMVAKPGVTTVGTSGKDVILGTSGNDTILGWGGDDVICGLAGNDEINANKGDDMLLGGGGDDKVRGDHGNDNVSGNGGNDKIRGGLGKDRLNGNGGKDRLFGDKNNDTLSGGSGNDELAGNRGEDKLKGGKGNDELVGGPGRDRLDGMLE